MKSKRDDALCWFCDYGLILLGILLVLIVALLQFSGLNIPTLLLPVSPLISQPNPIQLPSGVTPAPQLTRESQSTATQSPIASQVTAVQSETPPPTAVSVTSTVPSGTAESSTPTSQANTKPTYIIAFIPLKWTGSAEEFSAAAHHDADFAIRASNLDRYFNVSVVILTHGPEILSLATDDILDKIIEYGVDNSPADRYVGLTDGDIIAGGSADVAGWTYGPDTLGVVAESKFSETTAHELGHTFGLCDEYNYSFWKTQNEEFKNGCPNPYPATCSKDVTTTDVICLGNPTGAGLNSIMGPSGIDSGYGFNQPSFTHLQEIFLALSKR